MHCTCRPDGAADATDAHCMRNTLQQQVPQTRCRAPQGGRRAPASWSAPATAPDHGVLPVAVVDLVVCDEGEAAGVAEVEGAKKAGVVVDLRDAMIKKAAADKIIISLV